MCCSPTQPGSTALRPSNDLRTTPSGATPSSDWLFHRLLDKLPAGAYTCDGDGLITYYNHHAVHLWGREPRLRDPADRYCGSFRLFTTDGAPIAHDDCWMALALRHRMEHNGREIVIEQPGGMRVTVLAHANPILDEGGALLGAVNVLVDISDRKRAEDAVRDADRAKSEFLATMSHEIRTPINAIIGYLDLLDVEVAGPLTDLQRMHVGRTRAASRHLLSLITEVLDLAKVESGQMVVRRERRRAADAAAAALAVVQPLAAARGLTLTNACPAHPDLWYEGDEDRVRQMLINLLSNAIKFTEPGGRVNLECSRIESWDGHESNAAGDGRAGRRAWLCFRVRDTGIGIDSLQLERIFQPFVQLEPPHTRRRGGTGLGLAIARKLARLMGGELSADSIPGQGSSFTLRLPVAEAAPHELAESPADVDPAISLASAGHAFRAAGHAIMSGLSAITREYVERLRDERVGAGVRALSTTRLANHVPTLLSDIAVTLLALGDGDAALTTFGASVDIQRACARQHGRHRAQLGWDESDVSREYQVLWEETERCIARAIAEDDDERGAVLAAVRSRIERARVQSVRALQAG